MAFNNYIFDFDGTLIDTTPLILRTMAATFEKLKLPQPSESECRNTIGLRLDDIPKKLFPDRPEIWKLYAPSYREIFCRLNTPDSAAPFPGVIDTLRNLYHQGHRLAIASSRSHASLAQFIEQMDISGIMAQIVGGDDVKNGKPAPDAVLCILERQQWAPEDTIVVGDMAYDIQMGHGAGACTCGVTYGNGSIDSLAGADYIIDEFPALAAI